MLATLARELHRRDARYGLQTMCIGGGRDLAAASRTVGTCMTRWPSETLGLIESPTEIIATVHRIRSRQEIIPAAQELEHSDTHPQAV